MSPGIRAGILWLLAFMMVFAPLFRAGQPPIPLLVLELAALLVLVLVLWKPGAARLSRREVFAVSLLVVFPLLYLLPLPGVVLDWLPGREQYVAALSLLGADDPGGPATLSLYPIETESAWLALLVPIAVFLGTRALDSGRLFRLVLLLFGVAGAQAVLGLMQFGDASDSPLYLGMTHTHFGSGVGTFTNRNHLAGLIEMVLPITLALFFYSLGRVERRASQGWRGRLVFFASMRGHTAFLYGALALLLILGVIFTRSRTGIALTILGVVLVTFAFSRRIGGDNVYGPAGTVAAFALGLGMAIGLAPVLDRFASLDPLEDGRWTMFSATLDGIGAFFPVGSGPGNYSDVFHAFQPLELGNWFINHAHNDYLEWLFEGGILAALLILLLFGLFLFQWSKVWTKEGWSRFRFMQVGAGIGILLLLLHELVDYNLQIPANRVYFAFLVGVFFSDPNQESVAGTRRPKRRRTPDLSGGTGVEIASSIVKPAGPAPDQIKNPFLD